MLLILALLLVVACLLALGLARLDFNRMISGTGIGSASQLVTVTAEAAVIANATIAPAKSGTLTTRVSGTAGTFTMEAGHGITTASRIDIYWTGGQCYGATVGTVSGTSVPITAVSGGDALPVAATAVTVGIINTSPFAIIGDDMVALVATIPEGGGYVVWADGSGDLLAQYVSVGVAYAWKTGDSTNPIAGDTPTKVYMSQKGITNTLTGMTAVALVN